MIAVELFLEKYGLLKPKNNIIVAFSGGYDSMCLLHVMKNLSEKHGFNLIAIHLNHNWRGHESDSEEENCRKFCKDITFYSEKLADTVSHTETAAREARYEFFEKCAEKFNSNVILTAHNANDNAETVFYRITRGTGITGLEGIQEHRNIYYRPLLSVYRDEIEQYCKGHNLTPNNDSSNTDTGYARNKIRHEIFPALREFAPDIEKCLNNLSQSAKTANKLINRQIKDLESYTTGEFCELEEGLQTAVLHRFFRDKNLDYDRKRITDTLKFILDNKGSKSGKTCSLSANLRLFVNSRTIKPVTETAPAEFELNINGEGEYALDDKVFSIQKTSGTPETFPDDASYTAYATLDRTDLVLRTRKDGDIIQPLGLKGTQKLKKFLNGKKIPKHEKDKLVFLCKNNEILWAPGLGISEKIKVTTKPTHILKLEERGIYGN